MIPERLLNRTLTWQRPTAAADRYGDDRDDWTTPTTSSITGRIDQLATDEVVDETRDLAAAGRVLFTNEVGIGARHRIVDGTLVYEVDGIPAVVDDPFGPHHVEARLRLIGEPS